MFGAGTRPGERAQRAIGRDDVGRLPLRARQLAADFPQPLEQIALLLGHFRQRRRRVLGGALPLNVRANNPPGGHALFLRFGRVVVAQAVVARAAAALGRIVAEIAQQHAAPARFQLAVIHHLPQALEGALAFVLIFQLIEEIAALMPDAGRVEKQALRRIAVAPRAPGLLVVSFDRLRHIEVNDAAHIRFVDAHAERDRGADHRRLIAIEALLRFRPRLRAQPGVVGERVDARLLQLAGDRFRIRAAQRIDDRRRLRVLPQILN